MAFPVAARPGGGGGAPSQGSPAASHISAGSGKAKAAATEPVAPLQDSRATANSSLGCLFALELENGVVGGVGEALGEQQCSVVPATVALAERLAEPSDDFARGLQALAGALRGYAGSTGAQRGYAVDPAALARLLEAHGRGVAVRATPAGPLWGHGGGHAFLVASDRSRDYVLEPNLKEVFAVAAVASHAGYAAVLSALPDSFVGTRRQLAALVEFLCEQLALAFAELDVAMPPWRATAQYLAKWEVDESILAAGSASLLPTCT